MAFLVRKNKKLTPKIRLNYKKLSNLCGEQFIHELSKIDMKKHCKGNRISCDITKFTGDLLCCKKNFGRWHTIFKYFHILSNSFSFPCNSSICF